MATVHRKKKQWLTKMEEMPEERLVRSVYGRDAWKETEREAKEKMGR